MVSKQSSDDTDHSFDFLASLWVRDNLFDLHNEVVIQAKHSRCSAAVCHLRVLHSYIKVKGKGVYSSS